MQSKCEMDIESTLDLRQSIDMCNENLHQCSNTYRKRSLKQIESIDLGSVRLFYKLSTILSDSSVQLLSETNYFALKIMMLFLNGNCVTVNFCDAVRNTEWTHL